MHYFRAWELRGNMTAFKHIIRVVVLVGWVPSVAFAADSKTISFKSISIQDVTEGIDSTVNDAQIQVQDAAYRPSPVRKIETIPTADWLDYVQVNRNSLFLRVKF